LEVILTDMTRDDNPALNTFALLLLVVVVVCR
jgi:hypothetical protein